MNFGILILGIVAIIIGVFGFYKAIKKSKHEQDTKSH
jgi:hypothetical protein